MSEYKGIKGFQVQTRTEDPVPYAQALVDNPYAGVFSSGGAMNTVRTRSGGTQAGTLTAGLVFGTPNSPKGQTEEYNGTSWTESGDLNTGRYISYGGGGTQTSAITAGGFNPPNPPGATNFVEQYNGSSWTETTEVNTARFDCSSFGTYNAMKLVGGATGPGSPGTTAFVEDWNGSAWTETTDLPTARQEHSSWGITTAGAIVGGSNDSTPTMTNETLEWDGSSWSEGGDYPTVLRYSTAFGSSTDALAAGGSNTTAKIATAAAYNGSAWTEVNSLATARDGVQGNGTGSSGFVAGGETSTAETTATEEWTFSGLDPSTTPAADYADAITGDFYYNSTTGQFKTVNTGGAPIGSWSSGGSLNTSRGYLGGGAVGTRDSMIAAGGYTTTSVAVSEQYDGSSWTETSDLNVGRYDMMRFGTATAAFHCGGEGLSAPPYPQTVASLVESWNGSSWTETTDMPNSRRTGGGAGTTTSGLVYGGQLTPASPQTNTSLEWNGSAWTEGGAMNTTRRYFASYGTQTAGHAVAGRNSSNNRTNVVEEYNGSAWTELADVNTTRDAISGSGVSTDSLVYGGDVPATTGKTEFWNGSSWTEVSDMATARQYFGSAGSSSSNALAFGNVASSAATEEWTAADFQIKTVTTS